MARSGLGRGLRALIPDLSPDERGSVVEVNVDVISPNRYQPRKRFDEEKMAELAASIKEHGVVQPVVARTSKNGYELVIGERRWRAAKMAGLKTIPVVVREFQESEMMELALIENLQREDLNPIEEAEAYARLIKEFGLTQDELAVTLGKSRPAIANMLRLLNLAAEVQDSVSRGTISMGHARALLGIEAKEQQLVACNEVIARGLSVRETEELVREWTESEYPGEDVPRETGTPIGKPILSRDSNLVDLEERLKRFFGTQVRIKSGKKKNTIEIEYYSAEDLQRILDLFRTK